MSNYSLIKDGKVVNVIVADENFIVSYAAENGFTYVDHDEFRDAVIGAETLDGKTFKRNDLIEPVINQTADAVVADQGQPQ